MSPVISLSVDVPAVARARSPSRLLLLDGIRGYLLVAMYAAHFCIEMRDLGLFSALNFLRHTRWLPVGDIEFFLPLSGFVVALSYHGIHAREGNRGIWRTVGNRMRWIYGYQVVTALLLVLLVQAGVTGINLRAVGNDPAWLLALKSFNLAVLPENLDILVLNLVLLPFVPLAFGLLARGKTRQFYAALAFAWGIAQIGLDRQISTAIIATGFNWPQWIGLMGHFSPLSYAILFFGGFGVGFHYKIDRSLFTIGAMRPRANIAGSAMLVLAGYAVAYHLPAWQAFVHSSNTLLSPHALIVTFAAYYVGYWLLAAPALRGVPAMASNALRWLFTWRPLVFLGSNSLLVYACHVIAVALGKAAIMAIIAAGIIPGQFTMLAVFGAGLISIVAATALKRRYLPWAS